MILEPLDWRDMQLDSDPSLLRAELMHMIEHTIERHPRTAQRMIGPSELGTPCTRRLALRLVESFAPGDRPKRRSPPRWRPTVGTAVHAWLAGAFDHAPSETVATEQTRWVTEHRVMVGTVGGQEIWGSADLYDRVTATVIDWKIVGATTLRKAKASVSQQYRTQLHLYGRGFRNQGLPVERVAILYLPASGELRDAAWWIEDYSETVATQAIARADGLLNALSRDARQIIPLLPTADNYCSSCPWWAPTLAATDTQCPGHTFVAAQQKRDST